MLFPGTDLWRVLDAIADGRVLLDRDDPAIVARRLLDGEDVSFTCQSLRANGWCRLPLRAEAEVTGAGYEALGRPLPKGVWW